MVEVLAFGYLGGWMVVTLLAYTAARRFSDPVSPSAHPIGLSVAAGALWPLLVAGLVELSSVMVFTKTHVKAEPGSFA